MVLIYGELQNRIFTDQILTQKTKQKCPKEIYFYFAKNFQHITANFYRCVNLYILLYLITSECIVSSITDKTHRKQMALEKLFQMVAIMV